MSHWHTARIYMKLSKFDITVLVVIHLRSLVLQNMKQYISNKPKICIQNLDVKNILPIKS
jgi:hypothetical protein